MKRGFITLLILFINLCLFSQVAINTESPSSSAVLFLKAENINTATIGGFLLPVVTETQQNSIPVSISDFSDDGLQIFVNDPVTGKKCWEIYDAYTQTWRSIHCYNLDCNASIIFEENFENYQENTGVTGVSSTNGNYPDQVSKWTLTSFSSFGSSVADLPGTLIDEDDYALVKGGRMEFKDTNGLLQFKTQEINISGYSNIQISMDIDESGSLEYVPSEHINNHNCGETESDFFDVFYSTNGGASFIKVEDYLNLGTANHTLVDDLSNEVNFSISNITGNSLIIMIQLQNWAASEIYYLDNILVQCN